MFWSGEDSWTFSMAGLMEMAHRGHILFYSLNSHQRFHCFLQKEEGRERGKHPCERETSIGCLPNALGWGLYEPRPGINSQPRHGPRMERNLQSFGYGEMLQSTEPKGSGPGAVFYFHPNKYCHTTISNVWVHEMLSSQPCQATI